MSDIGLYREKHGKIFLSETIMPRALIFGMRHDLVDFYQVCWNYAPWAKIDLIPGVNRDMASFQQIPICELYTKLSKQFRATWPSCLLKAAFFQGLLPNTFQDCNINYFIKHFDW